jgi:heme-degrading monooxygenase HmoA
MTERVVVIHHVEDYQRWREAFDAAEPLRVAGGELAFEVLQADDDPTLVVHIATWSSLADARRFFESPEVVAIRASAGVSAPDFHYLHRRE